MLFVAPKKQPQPASLSWRWNGAVMRRCWRGKQIQVFSIATKWSIFLRKLAEDTCVGQLQRHPHVREVRDVSCT